MLHHQLIGLMLTGLLAVSAPAQFQGSASYSVSFQSTWSVQTHPNQFPANAHFTNVVGVTHSGNTSFWRPGVLASAGIRSIAESGNQNAFITEALAAFFAGASTQAFSFSGIPVTPGQTTVVVPARVQHPQLTLVSKLAPSPDWFVGVSGIDLIQNGQWIQSAVVPLHVYDAGTDSGTSYNSANAPTVPPIRIAPVTTASGPFQGASTQIGTVTITREWSTQVYGCNNPANSMYILGAAQLGQTLQFMLADPTGEMLTPAGSAVVLSTSSVPCGLLVPGLGLANGTAGEVLLGSIDGVIIGTPFTGSLSFALLTLPPQPNLIGQDLYFQGVLATTRAGLTRAVRMTVGG